MTVQRGVRGALVGRGLRLSLYPTVIVRPALYRGVERVESGTLIRIVGQVGAVLKAANVTVADEVYPWGHVYDIRGYVIWVKIDNLDDTIRELIYIFI